MDCLSNVVTYLKPPLSFNTSGVNEVVVRVGKGDPKEALVWIWGQIPSLGYKGCACVLNACSCSPTCTNSFYSTGDNLQIDSGKKSWARNRDFCMCLKLTEVSESCGVQQRIECTGRLSLRLPTSLGGGKPHVSSFCPLILIVSCQLECELWSRMSSLAILMWYSYQITVILNLF